MSFVAKKIKRGFSLIELSIVVAVIAILFAAVIQVKNMVSVSKISTARSLTLLSPVSEIDGLQLWLETTMIDSFDANEAVDGGSISTWYDLNPQSTTKHDATQTVSNRPTYIENAVNGLPAVNFDGTDDSMIANDLNHNPGGSEFFIFVVADIDDNGSVNTIMSQQDGGGQGRGILQIYAASDVIASFLSGVSSTGDAPSYNPQIYAIEYQGTTLSLYIDGDDTPSTNTVTAENAYGDWRIGSHKDGTLEPTNGSIMEIIFYDRALSDVHREDVEDYLSQKWGIELNE